jgi:hypothetical protein
MDDSTARIVAAVLTGIATLVAVFAAHRLSASGDKGKTQTTPEKIEPLPNDKIKAKSKEIIAFIDSASGLWTPDSEQKWKKVKKEKFSALVGVIDKLSPALGEFLILLGDQTDQIESSLISDFQYTIPRLISDFEILKNLEKEKSDLPSDIFNRLSDLQNKLSALVENLRDKK